MTRGVDQERLFSPVFPPEHHSYCTSSNIGRQALIARHAVMRGGSVLRAVPLDRALIAAPLANPAVALGA